MPARAPNVSQRKDHHGHSERAQQSRARLPSSCADARERTSRALHSAIAHLFSLSRAPQRFSHDPAVKEALLHDPWRMPKGTVRGLHDMLSQVSCCDARIVLNLTLSSPARRAKSFCKPGTNVGQAIFPYVHQASSKRASQPPLSTDHHNLGHRRRGKSQPLGTKRISRSCPWTGQLPEGRCRVLQRAADRGQEAGRVRREYPSLSHVPVVLVDPDPRVPSTTCCTKLETSPTKSSGSTCHSSKHTSPGVRLLRWLVSLHSVYGLGYPCRTEPKEFASIRSPGTTDGLVQRWMPLCPVSLSLRRYLGTRSKQGPARLQPEYAPGGRVCTIARTHHPSIRLRK